MRALVSGESGVAVGADPSTLIRVMLDRWDDAFHAELGYRSKNLIFEVRDIRNDWAHNSRLFDDDDTDRALDSIERLLGVISATAEAGRLKQIKEDRRRARYINTTRDKPAVESQIPGGIPRNGRPTKWESFAGYLRETGQRRETTIRNRVSNCKRVEQFEGDLEDHFDKDECQNVLARLAYTSSDQDLDLKPKHDIPIHGDIRTGSATLKHAVALYVRFRQHRGY